MTAIEPRMDRRTLAAPAVWSGRILSGVLGVFLIGEGLSRLVWQHPLVPVSETCLILDPALQSATGGALVLGAGLLAPTRTYRFGTLVLTLCLAVLLAAEAAAVDPSISHVLFWIYVLLLTWTGSVLRSGLPRRPIPVQGK